VQERQGLLFAFETVINVAGIQAAIARSFCGHHAVQGAPVQEFSGSGGLTLWT